ncbi:MAG TPA: PDZ domain-containing protein [Planctomycetota bacterium]|nr:PDZ domain-containing protein [Planctomycetota bacterium]
MNINSVRALIWLVDVVLVGGTGYTVYSKKVEKDERARQTNEFRKDLSESLGKIRIDPPQRPAIATMDQFRAVSLSGEVEKPKVEAAPTPTSMPSALEPLENLIRVVAIQYSSDQEDARVALFKKTDKDQPNENVIFGVNDVVFFAKGAAVKAIFPDRVTFAYGDGEATLAIATEAPKDPSAPAPPGAVRPTAGSFATGITSSPDSSVVKVNKEGRAAIEASGDKVIEGVRWSSVDLGEGARGLKLDDVPANNELARHGVQSGDILVSVNGTPMSSKSEIMDYAKRNPKGGRFDVKFLRNGRVLTRTVIIEQ